MKESCCFYHKCNLYCRAPASLLGLNLIALPVGQSNCSYSAFRLLATCLQVFRHSAGRYVVACFPIWNSESRSLRWTKGTSYLAYGTVPRSKFIWAIFGKNYSVSTAPPTNSSLPAIFRESAEASPKFAYAIILTLVSAALCTGKLASHALSSDYRHQLKTVQQRRRINKRPQSSSELCFLRQHMGRECE